MQMPVVMASYSSRKPQFGVYIMGAAIMLMLISGVGLFDYALTGITGMATSTQTTGSNVTISGFVAISLSNNLTEGISFGTITTLPSNVVNATFNYHNFSIVTSTDLNFTLYNASVSSDSNQAVDFCVQANTDLCTSACADSIGIANFTWADNSTNNLTDPPGGPQDVVHGRSLTTSYVKGEINIGAGSTDNYRFWLNVSAAQAAGDYNNTVDFRGVTTGDACGS